MQRRPPRLLAQCLDFTCRPQESARSCGRLWAGSGQRGGDEPQFSFQPNECLPAQLSWQSECCHLLLAKSTRLIPTSQSQGRARKTCTIQENSFNAQTSRGCRGIGWLSATSAPPELLGKGACEHGQVSKQPEYMGISWGSPNHFGACAQGYEVNLSALLESVRGGRWLQSPVPLLQMFAWRSTFSLSYPCGNLVK